MSPAQQKENRRYLATVAVVLAIIAGVWWNQDRGLKAVADETHGALCALKNDIERRHRSAMRYLADHPGPEPIPGITREQIQDSIKNQKATLNALRDLSC